MILEMYIEKAVMLVESGYSIVKAVEKVKKEYKLGEKDDKSRN